jgi:hypothetical protein
MGAYLATIDGKNYGANGHEIMEEWERKENAGQTATQLKASRERLRKGPGEYRCHTGDWVRKVSIITGYNDMVNGLYAACYDPNSGLEYNLFDGFKKYFPKTGKSTSSSMKRTTPLGYDFGNAIVGRSMTGKSGIQGVGDQIVKAFQNVPNALGAGFKAPSEFKVYDKIFLVEGADKGFTKFQTWSEPGKKKRLRALQLSTPDGKVAGPGGLTTGAGIVKESWSCPRGTVLTGMTPRMVNNKKNDVYGISFTCGNPAQTGQTAAA